MNAALEKLRVLWRDPEYVNRMLIAPFVTEATHCGLRAHATKCCAVARSADGHQFGVWLILDSKPNGV